MKRIELANARKLISKSQKEVSLDLGISEIYVRKLEAGEYPPGRDLMLRIGKYYSRSIVELFPDIFLLFNDSKCFNGLG